MNIEVIEEEQDRSLFMGSLASEHQVSAPTAKFDGVSFPRAWVPDSPTLMKALASSVIAVGTLTLGSEPVDLETPRQMTIAVDTGAMSPVDAAAAYAKLREAIVEAGIPLLADEELRQEIRDRKGLETEQEA